jgi:peptidoglycan/xylan/chitin deacetylase (PgdA/CDA1 family)
MLGARSESLVILGWHNVEPTWCFPGCSPPAAARRLRNQLVVLRRTANVLPLSAAVEMLRGGGPLPPRAVVLTFDDGYRDNVTVAAPLLARLGLPATFFLAPGLLDGSAEAWWEEASWALRNADVGSVEWDEIALDLSTPSARIASVRIACERLKRRNAHQRRDALGDLVERVRPRGNRDEGLFMSWDDAAAAVTMGIEIGSHTRTHPILSEETYETQRDELSQSRAELSTRLGVAVDTLAYPNGTARDYTADTTALAESAGYRAAVTTMGRANDAASPLLELGRFCVDASGGVGDLMRVTRALRRDERRVLHDAAHTTVEETSGTAVTEMSLTEPVSGG